MRTIRLPVCNLTITCHNQGGSCQSDLHDHVPKSNRTYHAAMNAIESRVLAHACAGINIESPTYLEGLETAVIAINDRYGE